MRTWRWEKRPIRWNLIWQEYDQMMKYATALRVGTADVDTIVTLHATKRKIIELRKAGKSIRKIAAELGIGVGTVHNYAQK